LSQVLEFGIDDILVVSDVIDVDGDELSYTWLKGTEELMAGTVTPPVGGKAVPLPDLWFPAGDPRFGLGTHVLDLVVSDDVNDPVSASVTVEITDTMAPTLSPIPSVTLLWPPNHELHPVVIEANAFDNGGGPVQLAVAVESNEPPDGNGDGNTIPDFYIDSVDNEMGIIVLRLRAERSGSGEGRVYTLLITASDASGNQSESLVEIRVPHDRGRRSNR
jgi:hypothetical protein